MCLNPLKLPSQPFPVPCGKCIECRIDKSRIWAYRITLECRNCEKSCMVTLTYDDEHLPSDRSVSVREIQLFMKRLRKLIYPAKVRYFACGEYGSKRARPHYHIILFDYDFPDKYFFRYDNKKSELYRSPTLEKLWKFGFSSVVSVDYNVAKYVAIYLQKPCTDGRHRPFVTMSKKPGIGFDSIKPDLLISDKIYLDGKYIKLPRYFLNVLEKNGFSESVYRVKLQRKERAQTEYVETYCDDLKRFAEREKKIKKFEKIFGKTLDKNGMP